MEIFHWDGNKLKCKMFRGTVLYPTTGVDYEITPTYKGNRIVRVDESSTGDYVEYLYDGKYLDKLVFHSGDDSVEATVEHKEVSFPEFTFLANLLPKLIWKNL